jgi:superfamily II DNA/RNA helicase
MFRLISVVSFLLLMMQNWVLARQVSRRIIRRRPLAAFVSSSGGAGADRTRLLTGSAPNSQIPSLSRVPPYYAPTSTPSKSKSPIRLFSSTLSSTTDGGIFSDDTTTFASLGIESPVLLERLEKLGLGRPTQVQADSFAKIKENSGNVILGAETGSGKTLAYLLPLLDDILQQKAKAQADGGTALSYDYARAVILVPNKELVQQVLRMAVPLCGGKSSVVWGAGTTVPLSPDNDDDDEVVDPSTIVRLAVMPGGLSDPMDFKPFRMSIALGGDDPAVDLVISTPAAIGPLALKPAHIDMFADIPTLVVDEADMLLDGGYIRPLENVLMGFRRADRLDPDLGVARTQHVFCAATLPDMGLKSVDAYLQKKFPYAERIAMAGMHNARHYGLAQATQWYQLETKKERMERLTELVETPMEQGGLLGEKVMVFLNSVDDVEGAQGALERAGVPSVPYHAKISLADRSKNLDRFRRYNSDDSPSDEDTVPILVCTDLASRGLDVPGVNTVVQLQFSGNVVSHLHRMGRCGRAGSRTGRGIVFYNENEAELVDVVREAEEQQERMVLTGDVLDSNEDDDEDSAGKVQKAFSRKRGFTKKRKKIRRDEREGAQSGEE